MDHPTDQEQVPTGSCLPGPLLPGSVLVVQGGPGHQELEEAGAKEEKAAGALSRGSIE